MNETVKVAVSILLLSATAFAGGGAHQPKPRTFRGEIWDSLCAEAGSHRKVEKMYHLPEDTQMCLATCIERLSAKYVLYNRLTGDVYQLDNQEQSKRYAGQKVKVIGSYDKLTHTIHVQEIEPAS
jgi:hypothetical protein